MSVHVADARAVLTHPSVAAAEARTRGGLATATDQRRLMITRHLLLRVMVGAAHPDHLHVAAGPCVHCGGDHGRLTLTEESGRTWHASVSSSGRYVAAAVSEHHHVGIDIEDRAIADGHLPDDSLLVHPGDDPTVDRLRLWVRKEAVLKATGEGLRTPMESFPATGIDIGGYRGVYLRDVRVGPYPEAVVSVGLQADARPHITLTTH